ncbi:hypothetical protein [Paractinoplanes rishiriensis]|uniref:PknH-like extracellular domain-containing protein n=1 Tax=Paractinoplanes rishiriensis TaxID=1050105 RepID=A0A919MWN8_9ACTN|nr:hypothetical protein [Actinoplanes rishiriensis]GIE97659.1 hypothetical protein Ari01nite_51240 [Actinoplanes rishiriensis]
MRKTLLVIAAVIAGLLAASAAATAQARPRGIPDRVMLQAEDLRGVEPGPVEDGFAWPLLPQPCADTPVPQPVASRSQAAALNERHRAYQYVGRYSGDGARAYLNELKAQLTRCRAGGGSNGFRTVAEDHLGPDTVLFNLNYDEGDRTVAYVAAATGHYVVVILVTDSLLNIGDLTLANDLAGSAIRRAAG